MRSFRPCHVIVAVCLGLVAAFVVLGDDQALASVSCGDKITADTTLHSDLVNCPNNGIKIGADNVTLDLNGHTIDGDGHPAAGCDPITEFCDVGVVNFRHDGVTVKDGSIHGFGAGIDFGQVRHNRLMSISATRNRFTGIQLFFSSRILVRNCSGDRSTAREGAGIGLFSVRRFRVLNSSFRHNAHVGIKPVDSKHGVVKGNASAHNGDEGFLMEGGKDVQIRNNRLVRNGAGITLGPGSLNVITGNFVARGRDGIRIEKGHRNVVAHNAIVGAHRAGIRLGIKHPSLGGANNTVRRNLVEGGHVDGFVVTRKDNHSLLKGNIARGAGGDGFDIAGRSTTLTSNRANRNGDLGIEAVRGVNDGGGNVARNNGDPRQCTNIACG